MANPFLNDGCKDVETAIMLEKAYVHDIGKAVAYTDGKRLFINTDDNLYTILPAYDHNMLKWLLWHERFHMELAHHNRFFKYVKELDEKGCMDEFQVTKEEVNIIMDILVHDSLSKMFPELVETAVNNLAQMRYRNSLGYTFTTFTLEEMLEEYARHKKGEDKGEGSGSSESERDEEGEKSDGTGTTDGSKDEKSERDEEGEKKESPKTEKKTHGDGGATTTPSSPEERTGFKDDDTAEVTDEEAPKGEHEKTDWSKLDDIESGEFITKSDGDEYIREINELKRKKIRLANISKTLNGLATTAKQRTYAVPSTIHTGHGVILKGRKPGKTQLHLCFDSSGSMSGEINLFKDIINKSIPQALDCPCTWFAGWIYSTPSGGSGKAKMDKLRVPYNGEAYDRDDYYEGKFKDFLDVGADGGYGDDGDRTIELCWKAEQKGYSPIGITDGGGKISWSKEKLAQLRRTVFVGHNKEWLKKAQMINPSIQVIYVGDEDDD